MKDLSNKDRTKYFSQLDVKDVFNELNIQDIGLTKKQIEKQKALYGTNNLIGEKDNVFKRFIKSFINPFSIVLIILAIISLFTDIIFAENFSKNYMTVVIITVMLMLSGIIRFIEELKSKKITDNLGSLVNNVVQVLRNGLYVPLPSKDLVVGDIVKLKAGDRVPADLRIIESRDCFVSQSIITGESGIQEKVTEKLKGMPSNINDYKNIAFMGSTIVSGYLKGIVVSVGENTLYGDFKYLKKSKNGFDKGANSIAWVLIRFMAVLVPIVFIASGFTKGNWGSAFLFALSVAVGLTPELLPMVITACLAKGSSSMGKKQTVVKNINAMQGFGSMDVLCIDKTGTLTNDTLLLEYYMDILGNEDESVLHKAYLNSYFHTGITNTLDYAILKYPKLIKQDVEYNDMVSNYIKLDEIPFDYDRKIASVLIKKGFDQKLIVKGSLKEVASRCSHVMYKNIIQPVGADYLSNIHNIVDDMLDCGMKVLAVAEKDVFTDEITQADEDNLTLIGYIAFFDAPKKTAASAIKKLNDLKVGVKILTGDNIDVAKSICSRLGIDVTNTLTGEELQKLNDNESQVIVEQTQIFAELTPKQKLQIVELLQSNGHSVGFLGDGINDLPAIVGSDVGISVDTAAPSVKEIADVVLLKKDLNVLEEGIIEGRKSFSNMSKYIKITASSNLGNIIAIVIASIFLPFFPMTAIQLLLLNLLYDILCLILPWDNVDKELCSKPLEWSGKHLSRFMLVFGPISSIFDIITFVFMLFYLCPTICGGTYGSLDPNMQLKFVSLFQTGWFLESMWTQILIIYLLRSKKMPFIQSRPSIPVTLVTLVGIVLFTVLTITPLGNIVGLTELPGIYFAFLIGVVIFYLLSITIAKKIYIKKYNSLI